MDYNIYLHNVESTEKNDPTKPWTSSSEANTNFQDKLAKGITKGIGIAENPDGIVSGAVSKGMGALAKVFPWIAVAYAVLKLTDKVISTANTFITTETGDYRFATQYNNFKAGLGACFRPVSTTINYLQFEQRIRIENKRLSMERELFGDSLVNGGAFYGV